MRIRLKEGKIKGFICIAICILTLSSCTKKDHNSVTEYQDLLKKLDSREIKTIEVLYIPYEVDMEIPQTVDNLKKSYWYKITVNFPLGVRNLEDALLNYSPIKETDLEDSVFRLGLLFFDNSGNEVYSMYFSDVSPKVRIGNKMFMVSKDMLDSIAYLIPGLKQEYFENQINSWFSENSKEENN